MCCPFLSLLENTFLYFSMISWTLLGRFSRLGMSVQVSSPGKRSRQASESTHSSGLDRSSFSSISSLTSLTFSISDLIVKHLCVPSSPDFGVICVGQSEGRKPSILRWSNPTINCSSRPSTIATLIFLLYWLFDLTHTSASPNIGISLSSAEANLITVGVVFSKVTFSLLAVSPLKILTDAPVSHKAQTTLWRAPLAEEISISTLGILSEAGLSEIVYSFI